MITAAQVRGARAILDVSRKVFAQTCGAHPNTIYNLEKSKATRSAAKVQSALEKIGFEFTGAKGVNLREDGSLTFTSPDNCDKFYNYLLSTAKEVGGPILAIYPTAELLVSSIGSDSQEERLKHLSRFASIRCLFSNAPKSSLILSSAECRAISENPYSHWSVLIFGNKLAHVMSENGKDFFFYVSPSVGLTTEGTKKFDSLWNKAVPLPNK